MVVLSSFQVHSSKNSLGDGNSQTHEDLYNEDPQWYRCNKLFLNGESTCTHQDARDKSAWCEEGLDIRQNKATGGSRYGELRGDDQGGFWGSNKTASLLPGCTLYWVYTNI